MKKNPIILKLKMNLVQILMLSIFANIHAPVNPIGACRIELPTPTDTNSMMNSARHTPVEVVQYPEDDPEDVMRALGFYDTDSDEETPVIKETPGPNEDDAEIAGLFREDEITVAGPAHTPVSVVHTPVPVANTPDNQSSNILKQECPGTPRAEIQSQPQVVIVRMLPIGRMFQALRNVARLREMTTQPSTPNQQNPECPGAPKKGTKPAE